MAVDRREKKNLDPLTQAQMFPEIKPKNPNLTIYKTHTQSSRTRNLSAIIKKIKKKKISSETLNLDL